MILKPAAKILLLFFFLFFFLFINHKIVLAEWPAGCIDSKGNWICSCDPTYCGGNCICGNKITTDTNAKCRGPNGLGEFWCEKTSSTYDYLCCPEWSPSFFCDSIWWVGDCVITPPPGGPYGGIGTCDVVVTTHTGACDRCPLFK